MQKKPIIYSFFRNAAAAKYTIIQNRSVDSGELLSADALECFNVVKLIETPWFKIRVGIGSRMLLAKDSSASLVAGGHLEPVILVPLIPWRIGFDEHTGARKAARRAARII